MLYAVLLLLWVLAMTSGRTMGGAIHLLPVLVAAAVVLKLVWNHTIAR